MEQLKIFDEVQQKKAAFIHNNKWSQLSDLSSSEVKELAVVWCYYSGKIEGNTYTYVETEALLKDNITSPKKYEDAKMLKNLYNAFVTVLEQEKKGNPIEITPRAVLTIHSMVTSELVEDRLRGTLRTTPVKISGTSYTPPKEKDEIAGTFMSIINEQNKFSNPLEKAVYIHCNIARLQPFIDGNKRTSRLLESIVLMNSNIIPVYSSKDADLLNYRKGLINFYETGNYKEYADYFLNRQIERINEITPKNGKTYDLNTDKIVDPIVKRGPRL